MVIAGSEIDHRVVQRMTSISEQTLRVGMGVILIAQRGTARSALLSFAQTSGEWHAEKRRASVGDSFHLFDQSPRDFATGQHSTIARRDDR